MSFKLGLILAFSLFALCVGEPECGPDQCKDLWSAKKCNKVKHCIQEEWSRIEPTQVRDSVCEICLKMVKEARDTLQSNETREELKEVLEGSCALLWIKPAVELCDEVVDQMIPELVDLLSSQMDPEAVCSVAKLCNNEAFWNAHKNSKECVHCEAFTESAEKELESVSLAEFNNRILEVCRTAGSFSDACSQIGMELSDVLHNTSQNILRSKPCEAVSLCPTSSKTEPVSSEMKVEVKTQMCPLCKVVMGNVREKLLRVRSAEEFAEKMWATCERMNFPNNTCSVISSPAFYEKLKTSDWLPNLFCSLTFCMEKPDEKVPVWPLLSARIESFKSGLEFDALELLENVEMFFLFEKQKETKAPVKRPVIAYGDPIENPIFFAPSLYFGEFEDCKTCRAVIDMLSKSSAKGLDTVCDKVQNEETCKRFLDRFSPILRKAIAEGNLSKKLCRELISSCKINQEEETSPESCSFCLNVMKVLKHGDSYFWGRALEDKCNDLHEKSQDKCKNLSSLFISFPSLFKNSTREIEVCSFLKMCRPSAEQHQSKNTSKSACQDCMLAVQTLADSLKSNQSSKLIEELLDSMCSLVPQNKRHKCEELVKIIGVDGLKRIIESFTPDEVCSKVHLCGRKTDVIEGPVVSPMEGRKESEVPCKFCLMMIKVLMDELQDNKTEAAIRKALNSLCKYFPEETRDTCKNVIDEYAEDIIDMIIADFNASEICTYLKICPPQQLIENSIPKEASAVFDIETNELRNLDIIKDIEPIMEEFSPRIGIVKLEEPKEEDFHRFHEFVQECALCEAVVGVISRHEAMLSKQYDFVSHAPFICSTVPAYKKKQCSSMVISYGPSIVNLIVDQKADPDAVCVLVDLCDPNMQAKVNQPVSVSEDKVKSKESNDCLLGPVFWCANAENAKKCGTFLHCQETVWKSWKSPPTRTNQQ